MPVLPAPPDLAACVATSRPRPYACWLLLTCSLLACTQSLAQAPGCLRVPFAQQVNVDAVRALALSEPRDQLQRIALLDIDLKLVGGTDPSRPLNPMLAGLPRADERLVQQAEFRESYEGRAIPAGAACCGLERSTVLIRDTASTYTLLHEVTHLLIVPSDAAVMHADLELRFAVAHRRLSVYQRRLYANPRLLLQPLWRDDIVEALREVSGLLFDRLRVGQSQEAIVERVLAECIDERSQWFDAARRAEGLRYGEAMIDNAIDVFNTVSSAVEFCDDAVRDLHSDPALGQPNLAASEALTARDQQDFSIQLREVRSELARVRAEIEALKDFYRR